MHRTATYKIKSRITFCWGDIEKEIDCDSKK